MEQAKAIAASWARSYIAAALAVYMAGGDIKAMAMGGVAAVVPVILRWLNPADKAFGLRGNDSETTRGRFSFDPFAKPCRVWL
jgi:hypothetical protein